MIDRALPIFGLIQPETHIKTHDTPVNTILTESYASKLRIQKWSYCSSFGCLSYIQAIVRPDTTFLVKQCARFYHAPNQDHEEAVKRICQYLLSTRDKGLVLCPDKNKDLEFYIDADWAGLWNLASSFDHLSTHSRTCFVILYAGCPILWKSKIQFITALSTTEAEYIALFQPFMKSLLSLIS